METEKLPPRDTTTDNTEQSAIQDTPSEAEAELHVTLMGLAGFLRACLAHLAPHWKQALLLLFTMFPEVALETVQPLLLMLLIDHAIAPGNYQLLIIIVGALLGLLLAYALSQLANLYLAALVGAKVLNGLRFVLFERLQSLSVSFYNRRKTGDILSRFTSDLDAVDNALVGALPYAV